MRRYLYYILTICMIYVVILGGCGKRGTEERPSDNESGKQTITNDQESEKQQETDDKENEKQQTSNSEKESGKQQTTVDKGNEKQPTITDKTEDEGSVLVDTFAMKTNVPEFQRIPLMQGSNTSIGAVQDFGTRDYMVKISGSTVSEYKSYLNTLQSVGFKKHSDNGLEAMEGYVHTAAYTSGKLTVVVYHIIRENATYITASYSRPLSDNLIYKDEYVNNLPRNAKTKVHLFQLANNGSCIIIQLKNGHFVIHDGGNTYDARYFMDYMRTLVPNGKIIVEAWFISHPHGDHYGVLHEMYYNKPEYAKEFIVNGVYFHYPHKSMGSHSSVSDQCNGAFVTQFKDEYGKTTKAYRPQLGQRYYFCDTIVDICLTTEQLEPNTFGSDVNNTSFWCKTFIDGRKGQTMLINGDSAQGGHNRAIQLYDKSYFVLDVYVVSHHGMNVYSNFVKHITPKTLLYPCFRAGSLYKAIGPNGENWSHFARETENAALRKKAQEFFSHGHGTVVMTFPYKVGQAQTLAICKWEYDNGVPPGRTQHPPHGIYEWGWRVWDENCLPIK